ncbi:acyl-[acyl-carrier-protein] thioesterase [Treponema pedis]|uniref:acyl-[acyl-carrier-protein] thioesterase n=1 Tax=Treponema pedis TaxID=409322 RepID=UPI00040FDFD2|nr:acyl-ACP thioesterase domain-containing protein [Treponema pedis]
MIFKETYRPVIEDFTKEGELSLFAVLKIFENIGNSHSDTAGDGVFKNDGSSTAWILTEWQIEVDSFPVYKDKIRAETWSEELKSPLIAIRDFLLYKNDSICIKGSSRWVLLDLKKERLCKIEKTLLDKYNPENKTVFGEEKLKKIELPEKFEMEKRIAVRKSDFDFNNHIHNLIYLNYASETLPDSIYEMQKFKKLRITYKTAIKSDKEVIGKYADNNGKKTVCIYDLNGQLKTVLQFE